MKFGNSRIRVALCPFLFSFLTFLLPFTTWTDSARGHEFEDGYVEHSVSVVIQDRIATIEFSVGCNFVTMGSWIEAWSAPELPTAPVGSATEESPTEPGSSPENGSGSTSIPPEMAASKSAEANSESTQKDAPAPSAEPAKATDSSESDDAPRPLTKEELKTEADFREALNAAIPKRLVVTCNGKPIEISVDSVELSPRHHVNAVATLKFEFPEESKIELSIVDNLFPTGLGNVRYSLKPRGGAMVSRSNVAPILIRAPRVDLGSQTQEERVKLSTIRCQLAFVSNSGSDN